MKFLYHLSLGLWIIIPLTLCGKSKPNAQPDEIKCAPELIQNAEKLRKTAMKFEAVQPEKADSLLVIGLRLVPEHAGYSTRGSLLYRRALLASRSGELVDALAYAKKALSYHEKVQPHFFPKIAYTHNLLGWIYRQLGDYQAALQAYFKALQIKEDLLEKEGISYAETCINTLTNIGEIYFLLKDWDHALNYQLRALALHERSPGIRSSATADLYDNLIQVYVETNNTDLANQYLIFQRDAVESLENPIFIGEYLANVGRVKKMESNFEEATVYFKDAMNIYHKASDTYRYIEICYEMGDLYAEKQNPVYAQTMFSKGIQEAERIKAKMLAQEGHFRLYQFMEKQKNWEQALIYFKKYSRALEEELTRIKELESPEVLGMAKEKMLQGKLAELKLEEKLEEEKNYWLNLLFAISVVALGILYFLTWKHNHERKFNNLKLRQKNEQLNQTLKHLHEVVSQLRVSEEKLTSDNQAKNHLLSILSHDLRSQFGAVRSFAEFLKDDPHSFSAEELKGFSERFYSSSEQLFGLFEDLMQWARSQMNSVQFQPAPVHLLKTVEKNMALYQHKAQEKQIMMKARVSPDLYGWTDPHMLDFIFRNLLSNSLKFTPKGGWITVNVLHREHDVRISISDNGRGIPDKVKAKLFSQAQTSQRGTSNEKGAGIGLFLCQEFAQKMGTTLHVSSLEGQGTTISFTLKTLPAQQSLFESELNSNKSLSR